MTFNARTGGGRESALGAQQPPQPLQRRNGGLMASGGDPDWSGLLREMSGALDQGEREKTSRQRTGRGRGFIGMGGARSQDQGRRQHAGARVARRFCRCGVE